VTDWSGIATDFIVLDRPMIFLDVDPPFRNGFKLRPEDRAGYVVGSLGELIEAMDSSVAAPELWRDQFRETRARTIEKAYGNTLDGRSSLRYLEQILALADTNVPGPGGLDHHG